MKQYIVYNSIGKILRIGICPDDMMEIQAGQDEFVMEGVANDVKHVIVDSKIVEYIKTSEDIAKEEQRETERQKEVLIISKMQEILRKQAIEELKKEGKIDDKTL